MPSTTTTNPLLTKRDEAIAAVEQENQTISELVGQRDDASRKARLSAGGRKANRVREIASLELDMAIEGVEFTPWSDETPSRSRLSPMTQEEIEGKLAAVAAVYHAKGTPDSVKHSADARIKALLKSAEKRGYTVSDPR